MCPDIADPEYGQIIFSPDQIAPFSYGTVANFSCVSGYGLNGGAKQICGGNGSSTDGVWSGSSPTCNCELCFIYHKV